LGHIPLSLESLPSDSILGAIDGEPCHKKDP
jgi:hypothetical protein